ncbi:hypothetical protein EMIHUDRAFT_452993, partial [Emiliania huxleyi CCMP1516]
GGGKLACRAHGRVRERGDRPAAAPRGLGHHLGQGGAPDARDGAAARRRRLPPRAQEVCQGGRLLPRERRRRALRRATAGDLRLLVCFVGGLLQRALVLPRGRRPRVRKDGRSERQGQVRGRHAHRGAVGALLLAAFRREPLRLRPPPVRRPPPRRAARRRVRAARVLCVARVREEGGQARPRGQSGGGPRGVGEGAAQAPGDRGAGDGAGDGAVGGRAEGARDAASARGGLDRDARVQSRGGRLARAVRAAAQRPKVVLRRSGHRHQAGAAAVPAGQEAGRDVAAAAHVGRHAPGRARHAVQRCPLGGGAAAVQGAAQPGAHAQAHAQGAGGDERACGEVRRAGPAAKGGGGGAAAAGARGGGGGGAGRRRRERAQGARARGDAPACCGQGGGRRRGRAGAVVAVVQRDAGRRVGARGRKVARAAAPLREDCKGDGGRRRARECAALDAGRPSGGRGRGGVAGRGVDAAGAVGPRVDHGVGPACAAEGVGRSRPASEVHAR